MSVPAEHGLFADHTPESAPAAARRTMTATADRFGYLPAAVARMATAPATLDGFLKLSGMFESTSLEPLAREVLIMTVATRNGCHVCVALHTARLQALGASPELIVRLRGSQPIEDEKLDAVRVFTVQVIERAGAVGDGPLQDFLGHGYTPQNALEVVLGIGAYTLSTLANRMTQAPLDPPLEPFAWG